MVQYFIAAKSMPVRKILPDLTILFIFAIIAA